MQGICEVFEKHQEIKVSGNIAKHEKAWGLECDLQKSDCCTCVNFLNGNEMRKEKEMRNEFVEFMCQEDGVGVIEVVLILVVLIGLVIIFKEQITKLLNNIFKEIEKQSKEVY